jgi:hypothetical protein
MAKLNKRYDLRLAMQFALWTQVYVKSEGKPDNDCEFWNEKEMGHIDTVHRIRMDRTDTVQRTGNNGTWPCTGTRNEMGHIATVHRTGTKSGIPPLCTEQEQNGAHRHCAQNRNKIGHIATVQRAGKNLFNTSWNMRLSWDSNLRHPAGVHEKTMNGSQNKKDWKYCIPCRPHTEFTTAFFTVRMSYGVTAHEHM